MNIHGLAKAFNNRFGTDKTDVAIKSALSSHRITCGREAKDRLISRFRIFNPEQAQFLKNNYGGRSIAETTVLFNGRFGTDRTLQQIKTFVRNRGITSGRTGFFVKGHTSWNKGTKGLTSRNKTSFNKGNVPPNRKPLGTERICPKDGFIQIKISEKNPYTGFPTRYKHKHVHIWEQTNGPVPKGMVVAFIDGDKTRCELDNLMLISRAELLNLNQHGYKDTPAELKPSVLALSKLQVKTWAREKKIG
ncbi:hypothetical protein LCGC14_0777910 [marine sediment metagenome]|uniref:HNH nuclease domain-containing protein n=1 Tax=marine sediment metagenome TaxID=412755 RepID=A0A0F9Q0L4_9ZZZZ